MVAVHVQDSGVTWSGVQSDLGGYLHDSEWRELRGLDAAAAAGGGWSARGTSEALARAVRAWLLAGGGGEVADIEMRRRERGGAERRRRAKRMEVELEDGMWAYLHSELRAVPSPPVISEDEKIHLVLGASKGTRGPRGRTQGRGGADKERGRVQRTHARLLQQREQQERRVEAAREVEARRLQRERAQRERVARRERARRLHLEILEEAERERKERWVQRELRARQEWVRRLLCVPSLSELAAAAAARHTLACQRAKMRAMRSSVLNEIRSTRTGLHNDNLGSARANLLVRRARYLYGRADIIHLLVRLGLAVPP